MAPVHVSFSRDMLSRFLGRWGQWPVLAHSLVATLEQMYYLWDCSLFLPQLWHSPWLWHSYPWGHSPQLWLTPPLPLTKAGPCGLQAQGTRGSAWQWSLVFLPGSCFSLESLSYVVLAPGERLMTVNCSPLQGVQYPKPEPQFPIPTHHGGCAANVVSAGKCWSTMILVMNYLHFILWASVVFPSKILKPPPHPMPPCPYQWHSFQVCENLFFFMAPSLKRKSPSQIICPIIFLYLLPYLTLWRFCASIQKLFCRSCSTCRCILYVIVGKKVISPSYSSIVCSCLLCHRLIVHVNVDSYLHFIFCSIGPCIYLCVCVPYRFINVAL